MFCAFLIKEGAKSQTIKSYVSGIKSILRADGYDLDEGKLLLDTLVGSCRLINDRILV